MGPQQRKADMNSVPQIDAAQIKVVVATQLTPDFLHVREALQKLRAGLAETLSGDQLDTFEIVGAEVLNNVVEHAFADWPEGEGSIDALVTVEDTRVVLSVIDNGHPMPGGTPPEGKLDEPQSSDIAALPEGGFGWGLIHTLSGGVSYRFSHGKNHLTVWIGL